jgi:succinoglycan biosynthesis transport protein ExoP
MTSPAVIHLGDGGESSPRGRARTPAPEHPYRRLARRKGAVLIVSSSLFVLLALVILQLPPVYRATALVTIDAPPDDAGGASRNAASEADLRLLRSPALARSVIARLRLDGYPAFNEDLRLRPWAALFDWRRRLPEDWADVVLGPPEDAAAVVDPSAPADASDALERAFVARVSGAVEPYASSLGVSFDSGDPRLAAAVANALAETFVVARMVSGDEAARRARIVWVSTHLGDLRARMTVSRQAADAWRRQSEIRADVDATAVMRETVALEAKLGDARAAREAADERFRHLQAGDGAAGPIGDLTDAPSVRALLARRAELVQHRIELSSRLGELHPTMQKLHDEIVEVGRRVQTEAVSVVAAARADAAAARGAEERLASALDARRSQKGAIELVRLAELERLADADRAAYDEFLARSSEGANATGAPLQPDARLAAPAAAPQIPFFPRRDLMLPGAGLLSLTLGAFVVLAGDAIARRRRRAGA